MSPGSSPQHAPIAGRMQGYARQYLGEIGGMVLLARDSFRQGIRRPFERDLWLEGEKVEAESWTWAELPAGHAGRGPALILDDHATALVPPGWRWRADAFGNLILEAGA